MCALQQVFAVVGIKRHIVLVDFLCAAYLSMFGFSKKLKMIVISNPVS
jgi:hypothetical protein